MKHCLSIRQHPDWGQKLRRGLFRELGYIKVWELDRQGSKLLTTI